MRLYSTIIPYLLLVSFFSGRINNFDLKKIDAINKSPYDGVAVALIGAYDDSDYELKHFQRGARIINTYSKKKIWPWIFLNRIIGFDSKKGQSHEGCGSNKKYFERIKGIDIYNEFSALDDFYKIYKISLKIAKINKSPGVVVDPEAYNNYNAYNLNYISMKLGRSENSVIRGLKNIGGKLAVMADEIYPEAVIWFLFTGLGNPRKSINPLSEREYRTISYIVIGMLEKIKKENLKLKVISGGMLSLGYCVESCKGLKERIIQRNNSFDNIIRKYNNLYLGGTIALWDNPDSKKGWMRKGRCGSSNIKSIKDFIPCLTYMSQSYNYVWIYAAGAAGYNPYDKKVSSKYNEIISEIKAK